MKKTTVILCTFVLVGVTYWAQARMVVPTGGGTVVSGGGAAATGNYRPNADVSIGNWSDNDFETSNLYADIDDAVTTGSAGDGLVVNAWEDGTTYEVGMAEITGSITSIKIHTRAEVSQPNTSLITIYISRDGTTWVGPQTAVPGYSDTQAWGSATFTGLSWDGTTDFRVRLIGGASFVLKIDVMYAEANPS